jgi:thiamine-monophosphate kinase
VTSAADAKPDEFETIRRLFRPLTEGAPEARGLLDDAAVIPSRPGFDLVVTKDAVVEGVHFLPTDPLDVVARKLLRVNLSDLAAKGADPYGYFLAVSWSDRCGEPERTAFAAGLAEDQKRYGIKLFGGDTTSTPGPLTASITALGWVPHGQAVARAGARVGDVVMVSGMIGDGWLGLLGMTDGLGQLEEERVAALTARYQLPEPRTTLARAIREHAHASADVSDGLIADAGHIAEASGVALELHLESLPLSRAAKAWLDHRADVVLSRRDLAVGGDDYEVVFTLRPDRVESLRIAAQRVEIPVSVIGSVIKGHGVRLLYQTEEVPVPKAGWRHD